MWRKVYLGLATLGLCATWFYNLQYFASASSFAFSLYLQNALVNSVTTAITIDIYICAGIFSVWAWREAGSLGMKNVWVYVVLAFGIGLAFAFPLFLATRESHLDSRI
jgi:uncharacterized membrane protein